MERKELLALKLQMGIAPATQLEPDVLRAMWQQLKFESAKAQGTQTVIASHMHPVTSRYIFV